MLMFYNHKVYNLLCLCVSYRDVCFVDEVLSTTFGDEQKPLKQKKCSVVFCVVKAEGSLQNEFTIRG